MFFQGTLQEGIASALQQSKLVVCFVTDGQTESQRWETELLGDESLKSPLETRAVTLRLQAGSAEAGYLAAIFPLPKVPTVVIIRNGELKEYIASGVSDEDFLARVRNALAPAADSASQAHAQSSSAQPAANSTSTESSGQATPSSTTEQEPNAAMQAFYAERAIKMEAKRKKEAEEAKALRKAKAEAKAAEAAKSGGVSSDPQSKHAEALKRKRQEARDERQRVLQAIEDDKAARKARQVEREAERRAAFEVEKQEGASSQLSAAPSSKLPSTTRPSDYCSLQIRLFDGSAIRNRFPSGSRLGTEVRAWIDENRTDDKTPYLFKVVLSPLPNKNIDTSEEGLSLQELGLTPSSTLILVPPPKSAVAAYPTGNPVSRLLAFILSCIMGFIGFIGGFLTTMFSTSGAPSQQAGPAASQGQGVTSGRDQGGMREPRERQNDQQFYNGNSTNFEPRTDDGED